MEIQAPSRGTPVNWTIHAQDDAQPSKGCNNARLQITTEYKQPTNIPTVRMVLETLRALWDHMRRTRHEGQAWLQMLTGDTMEYRLTLVTGEYQMAGSTRYKTLAWTRTTMLGPIGECQVLGELAKQLAPAAIQIQEPAEISINRSTGFSPN